ncbi:hypothetical protein OAO87_04345, partial [bacterium]|nr:hypothetical protein [bacterium]
AHSISARLLSSRTARARSVAALTVAQPPFSTWQRHAESIEAQAAPVSCRGVACLLLLATGTWCWFWTGTGLLLLVALCRSHAARLLSATRSALLALLIRQYRRMAHAPYYLDQHGDPSFSSRWQYDDGSCPTLVFGCTDSAAMTFRAAATFDDGSCEYAGCKDTVAINYDASALLPGSCVFPVVGCMSPMADNFYSDANEAGCAVSVQGCSSQIKPCVRTRTLALRRVGWASRAITKSHLFAPRLWVPSHSLARTNA